MIQYSREELKTRAFRRAALALHGHWEEGSGAHTRLFETLVPDEFVIWGTSVRGGKYREHAVPCSVLRDRCFEMFRAGACIDDVAKFIGDHLKIVLITTEEAEQLNVHMKLKNTMPPDWTPGGDVFARFTAAGITIQAVEL